MRAGYQYLGVVWPSVSDCEEIALSVYQEEVYAFAMRRLADSPTDWTERVFWFEQSLKGQTKPRWKIVTIMD